MNDLLDNKESPPNPTPDQRKLPAIRNAIKILGETRSSLSAGENTEVLQSALFKLGGILEHATLLARESEGEKRLDADIFVLKNQDGSMEFISMNRSDPYNPIRWSHLIETKEEGGMGWLRGRSLSFMNWIRKGASRAQVATLSDTKYRTRDVSGGLYEGFRRDVSLDVAGTDTNYLFFLNDGTIRRKTPEEILDIKDVPISDFIPKEIEIPADIEPDSTVQ